MKTPFWKKSIISLSILAVASTATLGFTQTTQAPQVVNQQHEMMSVDEADMMMEDLQYYLEDYKEGYRDGFSDGFAAALEQFGFLEDMLYDDMYGDMYFDDYEDDYDSEDYYDENIIELEEAPSGLNPSYLPEGFVFEDAYTMEFEEGISEDNAFYYSEATDSFLSINRINMTEAEAEELYGEEMMADVMTLPSIEIAGTTVYLEQESTEGDDYLTAYFSKAEGLYTVDSNVSEAEMNIILSSLLQE